MRILYLGDLVGEKTIDVLQMYLEPLKKNTEFNWFCAMPKI